MILPIKDIKFISAEQIDATKDIIVLRIPVKDGDGREADAIVRLDVQCYVDTDKEGDLLSLVAKNGSLPKLFNDAAPATLLAEQAP